MTIRIQSQEDSARARAGTPRRMRSEGSRGGRRGSMAHARQNGHVERGLASGLGWFSLGLGLAEVAAPGPVAQLIGVPDDEDNRTLLRAAGLREISSGIGILSQPQRAGWMWARVGGDVMDLALLGAALTSPRARRGRVAAATAAVLGVTLLDLLSGQRLRGGDRGERRASPAGASRRRAEAGVCVCQAITINRSVDEVYRFWRDFQNLPRFMSHLDSVTATGERSSRWKAKGPAGTALEWEADVIEDVPNQRIAWRTLRGDVDHSGSVRFLPAPGGRGTEVHIELQYRPPAGAVGAILARLFGALPEQQIERDLRAFKQVLETGEVVHSDASVHRLPHPGRPPSQRRLRAESEVLP